VPVPLPCGRTGRTRVGLALMRAAEQRLSKLQGRGIAVRGGRRQGLQTDGLEPAGDGGVNDARRRHIGLLRMREALAEGGSRAGAAPEQRGVGTPPRAEASVPESVASGPGAGWPGAM